MTNTRVNVFAGDDWADPILWYAKGVSAMQSRPLKDRTGWRFWGGMHGFDASSWEAHGYLSAGDAPPSGADANQFWRQCQHGSWYFLPWHRGYLLAFEQTVRAAVVQQGGPTDWALPYWNPFVPDEAQLPPAFASPTWAGGEGPNPLYVEARYGPGTDGDVFVPLSQVNLRALADRAFTGVSTGGSPGFGGVDTGFSHGGSPHGGLETQPHDWTHGLVGGRNPEDPQVLGLMSDPDTAGLDPIFWLHHCNIDRLWETWRQSSPTHTDPVDPSWLNGPASTGGRPFVMPLPTGDTWTYIPADVVSIETLGYEYDSLSPAGVGPAPAVAAEALLGGTAMASSVPELVGATTGKVVVSGTGVTSEVQLDRPARERVVASLRSPEPADQAAPPANAGDRVFLNLENVRGDSDATAFWVYLGLGPEAKPEDHPDLLAGSIAPFGLRKASLADDEHAGQGLTFVLDVTDVVNHLHLDDSFDVERLPVRLLPVQPVAAGTEVTVGRITIYRHGG